METDLVEGGDGQTKKSDHLVVLLETVLPRWEAYKTLRYSYYYYTEEWAAAIGEVSCQPVEAMPKPPLIKKR